MIKPSGSYVIFEALAKVRTSGIITALGRDKSPDEEMLIIEAIGPDVKGYKVGDRILADRNNVKPLYIDTEPRFAVKEEYIIGLIEGDRSEETEKARAQKESTPMTAEDLRAKTIDLG